MARHPESLQVISWVKNALHIYSNAILVDKAKASDIMDDIIEWLDYLSKGGELWFKTWWKEKKDALQERA